MERRPGNEAYAELRQYLELEGSLSVPSVDIAPAQPVHDLSRFPRGKPGFVRTGWVNVHAGAGTDRDTLSVESLVLARAPGHAVTELAVWLIDYTLLVSTPAQVGNLTEAMLGATLMDGQPTNQDRQAMLLEYWELTTKPTVEIVVNDGIALLPGSESANTPGTTSGPYSRGKLPLYLPPTSELHLVSVATGAITQVRLTARMWIGPRHSTPPGMA